MLYAAVAFSCVSAIIHSYGLTFPTSDVVDGVCYAYVFWQSRAAQMAYMEVLFFFCQCVNIIIPYKLQYILSK